MPSNPRSNTSAKALLSSRFRYAGRRLFFGRARLYPDRIELSGITWRGIHRRSVPLDEVARVRWHGGDHQAANFVLVLRNGETLSLWVAGSGLWKYRVEACLGRRPVLQGDLPGQVPSASAA